MTPETLLTDLRKIGDRAAADQDAADVDAERAHNDARTVDEIVQSCTDKGFAPADINIVRTLVGPCSKAVHASFEYSVAATDRRAAAAEAARMAEVHVGLQAAGAAGAFYGTQTTPTTGTGHAEAAPVVPATPENLDTALAERARSVDEDGDEIPDAINLDPVEGDDAPENPRFVDWSDTSYDPDDDRRVFTVGNEDGEQLEMSGVDTSDLEQLAAALAATILQEEHSGGTFDPSDERAILLESLRMAGPDRAVYFADPDLDSDEESFGRYFDWSTRLPDGSFRMEVGKRDDPDDETEAIVVTVTLDDLRRIHAQVVRTVLRHRKKWAEKLGRN